MSLKFFLSNCMGTKNQANLLWNIFFFQLKENKNMEVEMNFFHMNLF